MNSALSRVILRSTQMLSQAHARLNARFARADSHTLLYLAALRKLTDVVGGAESKRLYRHGRLASARGDEAGAVADKKIPHIMRAMKPVDHGTLRIVAHPASAEQVHAAARRARSRAPGFLRAGSLHDLERAVLQEFAGREIVGMV